MNKKPAVPPPNIVIIFADQLRPFELGCYGHPVVQTPQIDRLAAGGVRCEQVFYPEVYHRNSDQTYFDGTGNSRCVTGYCSETELDAAELAADA